MPPSSELAVDAAGAYSGCCQLAPQNAVRVMCASSWRAAGVRAAPPIAANAHAAPLTAANAHANRATDSGERRSPNEVL